MIWQIPIDNFLGGYSPQFYASGYPNFGNKTMAGSMLNADLTTAGLQQGQGLTSLTNGTQAGVVTTLIRSILDLTVTVDTTYGVGGALLYKIEPTTVTSSGTWPHTINKAAVTAEDGEDVAHYQGNLYYSYNHSGSAGDIGKYDLNVTFDDDWGSTTPSGAAALQTGPHQMIVGGNDTMYISNGRYVASYDGTTFIPQALDLPANTVIKSIAWVSDRLYISANRPDISGYNKNTASIYTWDGTGDSWETEIKIMGALGGLHVKNGVVYLYYQDVSNSGGFKLAYLNGTSVIDLANYSGGLPTFYQITDYKDFIIWNTTALNALWSYTTYPWQLVSPWTQTGGDDLIYAWGAGDKDLEVRFFQMADSGYTTAGAVSSPFGTPMIASNQTTSYKLAQFSGFDVNSNWKSLMFDITGNEKVSKINIVRINFDQLSTGARVDWKLLNSQGVTIYSDIISYSKLGAATTGYYPLNGKVAENFRLEFDYSNGSVLNTVKIKNARIIGSSD